MRMRMSTTTKTVEYSRAARLLMVYSFLFLASAAFSAADVADDEKYWKQKEEAAHEVAKKSYNPDPENVLHKFNKAVAADVVGTVANGSRRALRESNGGGCAATNPIDQCWRCKQGWQDDRKLLANCAMGFGRGTRGGADGEFYVVTDSSDDDMESPKEGTLRYGVIQERPLWIYFARDMVIALAQELIMTGNKTVDGRGANVVITSSGFTIQFVQNVIIHNLRMQDSTPHGGGIIRDSESHCGQRGRSDGDCVSIFGSSHIWVDHLSLSNSADGLVDAIQGSTAITISNCHFTNQNKAILLGANDDYEEDKVLQATVAFNRFGEGVVQRMPRCRYGFFHVVNNDYIHWLMYAIGGSAHPTVISQGNRFVAPANKNAKEVTKRESPEEEWKHWTWRSEGDLMLDGAFFRESGTEENSAESMRAFTSNHIIQAKPGSFVPTLTRFAGVLACTPGKPC